MNEAPNYGARIKAFRTRRGWTQAEASKLLGFKHRQSLAAIETGARGLSAQEFVRTAQVFGIDVARLSDPFVVWGEAEFCWRRSPNVTSNEIERVELEIGRTFGAYRHLRQSLQLDSGPGRPETGLTSASSEADAMSAGEALARRLCSSSSYADGLAAAVEEQLGIAVLSLDLPPGVSGAACILEGADGIVVNRVESVGRRNFNLAHELFHVLTWAQMPPRPLEDASQSEDQQEDDGPAAGGVAPTAGERSHVEGLADAFASGLLMPRFRLEQIEGVGRLPRGVEGLARWLNDAATSMAVSSMALGRKLNALGRLSELELKQVLRSRRLTHNGAGPNPAPLRYGKAFVRALIRGIEEGVLPMETASEITGLKEGELARLAHGFGLVQAPFPRSGWEEVRARASQWADYEDGWDGEGSIAPSQASLERAAEFAREAEKRGITSPLLRLYGDGEVEFGWKGDRASASVAFLDDGHVVAYVRRTARHPMFKLDRPFTKANDLGDLLGALREAF